MLDHDKRGFEVTFNDLCRPNQADQCEEGVKENECELSQI